MNRTILAALLLGLGTSIAFAQQLKPTFDVVSVRRQEVAQGFGDPNAVAKIRPGGVFSGTHSTVEWLLQFAYDIRPFQIIGGPDWIRTANFAIDARASSSESAATVKLMVQSLLQDRFRLVVRREQWNIPHLDLVLARPDRGLGPYLKEVTEECGRMSVAAVRKQHLPSRKATEDRGAMMAGTCAPWAGVVISLSNNLKTPVVDRTGLDGLFVWQARFASLQQTSQSGQSDPSLPPFRVAVEEQFGLALKEGSGPVDVLVIDSIQKPTEN